MRLAARIPAVLRENPQFRLLFAGQSLSMVGDRITFVALPFAVLETGGGAAQVGFVAAALSLPFFLFSLAAGVWADRLDRRAMMLSSDVVRLLCQALAATLLLAGVAEWWHLAMIAFVFGTADAFFQPAVYGLLPELVPGHQLQQANALRGLVDSSGFVVGPALAGILVVGLGAGGALLVDAATFVVSVVCLARLRREAVARAERRAEEDFRRGLADGWREVRTRSWVLAMLGGMGAYHLIVLPSVYALGPVLADDELGGAGAWALITAGFGAGCVVGQVILLRWRPRHAVRTSALCLIVASCQAAMIGSGLPAGAIAGLLGLAGICVTAFFTLWETSIQEHIPAESVSRVGSYDLFISTGLLPLGTAVAGPIAASAGLQETLLGMSVLGVLVAVLVLSVPSVRALTRPPAASA